VSNARAAETESHCPNCGRRVSSRAVFGLCPRCLVSGAVSELRTESAPATLEFGDYEVIEEIARGGMGVVFKARHRTLNRIVALKVVSGGPLASRELIERFRTEAETAAALNHPNIVPIYEVGEHEGQPFFSMEWIDGPRLDRAGESGQFHPRMAAGLMAKVARAVHFAHQRGVLHRDIKPANVLLDRDGEPHLTDFGLARIMERESTITHTTAMLGTPSYMAPEQARGEARQLTTAADVYSAGAVLYEALTGSPPFTGPSTIEVLKHVMEREPMRPSALNAAVDRDLETICLKCLEKEPAARYASALALAEDLERWLRHEPIHARPVPAWERAGKWVRRRPLIAALASGLVFTLVAGFAATVWQWHRAERQSSLARAAQLKAEQFIDRLDLERADARLAAGERAEALALFASVLRRAPSNHIAAERILSFLTHRSLALPVFEGFEHPAGTTALAPSPDGQWLLTGAPDGARVWHIASGRLERSFKHAAPASSVSWSPDGRHFACAFHDRVIRVWHAESGREMTQPLRTPFPVEAYFSADGERLVTWGWLEKTLQVWNWRAGELAKEIEVPRPMRGMRTLPVPGRFMMAYADEMQLRDLDGTVLARVHHPGNPNVGACSPDGRVAATTLGLKGVVFYEAATLQPLPFQITNDLPQGRPSFAPDGLSLVMGERLRVGELRDLRTGRARNVPLLHRDSGRLAWMLHDGQHLLTSGEGKLGARVVDARPGQAIAPALRHDKRLTSATFDPAGAVVLTTSHDGTARLWSAASGLPLGEPRQHEAPVERGAFTPDGTWFATLARDHTVRVWTHDAGRPQLTLEHDGAVRAVALSSNAQWIATSSEDQVRLWKSGTLLHELPQTSMARVLEFSPDETLLAIGTARREQELLAASSEVQLWDVRGEKVRSTLPMEASVTAVAFSPGGERVAIACSDGSFRLWDIAGQRWLFTAKRHEEGIASLAFRPDGSLLVTSGRDDVVNVFDARRGELRFGPLPHGETILHAEFSRDGRKFVTLTASGVLRVWDAASGLPLVEPFREISSSVSGWTPASRAKLWRADGEAVLVITADPSARIVPLAAAPTPAPAWLAELAECIAGLRYSTNRQVSEVTWTEYLRLRERLREMPGNDVYAQWVRWFFTDRSARALSPGHARTVSEHVADALQHGTSPALFEAVALQPTNVTALTRLAEAIEAVPAGGVLNHMNTPELLRSRARQLSGATNSAPSAQAQ
jgi:eukaryotic-like serine/threonine-protein kinase